MADDVTPAPKRPASGSKVAATSQQAFRLEELYPDAAALFAHRHPPVADVLGTCMVVLDASVLLYAYELKSESLEEIGRLYKRLGDEGRLVVPGQSAREFYKVRASKVAWLVDKLDAAIAVAERNPFSEKIRLLESNQHYQTAKDMSTEIVNTGKLLRHHLTLCKYELEATIGGDPVSSLYRGLLASAVVELQLDDGGKVEFLADLERRNRLKIAPGFTDQDKEDGGSGDLLIWKTLLSEAARRQVDCIFVTEERKDDWWIKSKGSSFQPRPELIDEYRRHSSGRSLFLMPLSAALAKFVVEQGVVDEVQSLEQSDRNDERYLWSSGIYAPRNIQQDIEHLKAVEEDLLVKRAATEQSINEALHGIEYIGRHINTVGHTMELDAVAEYERRRLQLDAQYGAAEVHKEVIDRELMFTRKELFELEKRLVEVYARNK